MFEFTFGWLNFIEIQESDFYRSQDSGCLLEEKEGFVIDTEQKEMVVKFCF